MNRFYLIAILILFFSLIFVLVKEYKVTNTIYEENYDNTQIEHLSNDRFDITKVDDTIRLLTDKQTNNQYLQVFTYPDFSGDVAITPILDSSGEPYVSDSNDSFDNRFTIEKVNNLMAIVKDTYTEREYLVSLSKSNLRGVRGIAIVPISIK